MINASASRFRILFNNVDYTQSVIDSVKFETNWDENKGLCLVSGSVSLKRDNEAVLPVEPENNPNIFIGGTCIYEEYDYSANQYVRHAHFGHTQIQTVPRKINNEKSYYISGITVELSCKLNYLSEKDLTGDCTGLLPGEPLTRRQIINNLITKASDGQGLLNDSSEPSDLITYPPESLNSIVDTVGLLALMSPDEPWFVWADGYGNFRLTKESEALQNAITLSYSQKDCIPSPIDSGDFGRPFSELKVNSVIQKVNVTDFFVRDNKESYTTLDALYGTTKEIVADNKFANTPLLTEGKYTYIITDFETYLERKTTYKSLLFTVDRGNGGTDQFTANGTPPNSVLPINGQVITTNTVRELFFFYAKPQNWDSCNPENNKTSLAGLVSSYIKIIEVYSLFEKVMKRVLYENRTYSYNKNRWLAERRSTTSVLTKKTGTYITQNGVPIEKFEQALGKIETWEQLSCDKWRQTVIETGPGGDADAPVRYDSEISTSPPRVSEDAPPSADANLPVRFSVCEESIDVSATIKINAVFNKRKTISFPFATSKEQLEKLAENRIKLIYQKAFCGVSFEISSYHSYFRQSTATPIFSILFTEPDETEIKLRSLRYIYESNFKESVIIIDSCKTGTINENDEVLEVGNPRKNIRFSPKIHGKITSSTIRTPKITKNVHLKLKTGFYKTGSSWFDIARQNWFSITRSKFFTIKR